MTTLMVSSPADLISTVPFLIGFHPFESLVVAALRGKQIAFTMRVDLPESDTSEEEAQVSVLNLAAVVLRYEPDAVTIVGYGDEPRVTPALRLLSKTFRAAQVVIVDELRVTDDRFWSYLCTDPSCCAEEGRPCPPANSVIAAEATFAGAVALPNRAALEAQLNPVTGDDRKAMSEAGLRATTRVLSLLGRRRPRTAGGAEDFDPQEDEGYNQALAYSAGRLAVREAERCYSTGGRLTDDDAAWLGLLLCDKKIRDYAWSRTRTREWELALWSDLVRRVDPSLLPAPAALLAFVAWRLGQGPLASIAVEKAREQEPGYPMAVLIEQALMIGLPPSALDNWPALEGPMVLEECLDAVEKPERGGPEDAVEAGEKQEVRRRSAWVHPPKEDRPPVRARSDAPRAKTAKRPAKREKRQSTARRRT